MPAAWKNSAMSRDSGAPPDTAHCSRPPSAACSFEKTSLCASARLSARPGGSGCPRCWCRLTSRPDADRPVEDLLLRRASRPRRPARIFAYTFSKTRGTLQMKCGRTSFRLSPTLSRFSANAVVEPVVDAEERLEPRERVRERQEEQVHPARLDGRHLRADARSDGDVVAVRLHDALRRPRRARRVDDGGDVVRAASTPRARRACSCGRARARGPAGAAPPTS